MLDVSAKAGGNSAVLSARQPAVAAMPDVSHRIVEDVSIAIELAVTVASCKGIGRRLAIKRQGRPRGAGL